MTTQEKHEYLLNLYKSYDETAGYLTTVEVFGDLIVEFLYPIEANLGGLFEDEFGDWFNDEETTREKIAICYLKTIEWLKELPSKFQVIKEYKHRKQYKLSRRDSWMFSIDFFSLVRENLNYNLEKMKEYYDMGYANGPQQVAEIEHAMKLCTALEFLDEHVDTYISECLHPEWKSITEERYELGEFIEFKDWVLLNKKLKPQLEKAYISIIRIVRECGV